jgi:hypothetical protein
MGADRRTADVLSRSPRVNTIDSTRGRCDMATAQELREEAVTAEDVDQAERRAADARERAALAGLSAARSFKASARQHEFGSAPEVRDPPSPGSCR